MKKRIRLSLSEAKALNVGQKQIAKNLNPVRVVLDQHQLEELNKLRHEGVSAYCETRGIDFNSIIEYWDKTKEYSIRVRPEVKAINDISKEIIEHMQQYSPAYPEIKRITQDKPHLLVVDPADVHIGKLSRAFETGEEYDSEIAVQRVREGVLGILNKSLGFNINQILLIIGNDILHIDTPKRTTTSGTPQDTDGMWYDNFLKAKSLYVELIEMLMTVADVHVTFNPSNHDYTNGFFLADVIACWFRESKNITFDVSPMHRKYYKYGSNLIGTTHGDGAKTNDLPLLMAVEAKKYWSDTKHRYVYTHHVHHKNAKDFVGVTVESLRSPSAADSWHHKKGYQHNPKAIEGFIHHPIHGQVARLTHIF